MTVNLLDFTINIKVLFRISQIRRVNCPHYMHSFCVGSFYISILSQIGVGVPLFFEEVPMRLRITNGLVTYMGYVGKMIWPHNLSVHYPYPDTVAIWSAVLAGFSLICISILVILLAHQHYQVV